MAFKLVETTTEPVLRKFYVTDSEAIAVGQALKFSSGRLTSVGDATAVAAIATHAVTAGTDQTCYVILVDPTQVWECTYTGTATPTIGTAYDMYTGDAGIDSDDSTGGAFTVIELVTDLNNSSAKICKGIFSSRAFG